MRATARLLFTQPSPAAPAKLHLAKSAWLFSTCSALGRPTVGLPLHDFDFARYSYAPTELSILSEMAIALLRSSLKALRDHWDGIDMGCVVDLFSMSILDALGHDVEHPLVRAGEGDADGRSRGGD